MLSNNSLFLCLDQGGHSSRALVFAADGTVRARASHAVSTQRDGVRVEHDPAELVATLQASADDALEQLGSDREHIIAAGLATQRSSIVCWDRETGAALSPVLSWQDTRAADWTRKYSEHQHRIHELTGLVLSPYYGVSKLLWCIRNVDEVAHALKHERLLCGPLASYLAQSLTGHSEAYADPANASRTLLWDKAAGIWSDELLQLFDMPLACLPTAARSRHHWGTLTAGGRDIPLTVVTGDQSAAVFAFGATDPGTVYANLGTGAFVQRAAPATARPGQLLASVVYQDNEQTSGVVEGTVNGAGSALSYIAQERGITREQLHASSADWLAQTAQPPLFINSVGGLGSPWWRSDIRPTFVPDAAADKDAIAAVLESIVFLLAQNIERLEELTGPAKRIVATGGLARVDPLLQRLADCTGRPVTRAQVTEATATGLAWLLAGLPQAWPGVHADAEFAPQSNPALTGRYSRWLDLMPDVTGCAGM